MYCCQRDIYRTGGEEGGQSLSNTLKSIYLDKKTCRSPESNEAGSVDLRVYLRDWAGLPQPGVHGPGVSAGEAGDEFNQGRYLLC